MTKISAVFTSMLVLASASPNIAFAAMTPSPPSRKAKLRA